MRHLHLLRPAEKVGEEVGIQEISDAEHGQHDADDARRERDVRTFFFRLARRGLRGRLLSLRDENSRRLLSLAARQRLRKIIGVIDEPLDVERILIVGKIEDHVRVLAENFEVRKHSRR